MAKILPIRFNLGMIFSKKKTVIEKKSTLGFQNNFTFKMEYFPINLYGTLLNDINKLQNGHDHHALLKKCTHLPC